MDNYNRNSGTGIFYGVIGVATLVVAIIGATFAFFSATAQSANDAVNVSSTAYGLDFADTTGTNLKTKMIPATEAIAKYAALEQTGTGNVAHNQCIDDNGREVCSVYQFTVSNSSSATLSGTSVTGGTINQVPQTVSFSIKVATNEFTNLKYSIYEGVAASLTKSSTAVATGTFAAANSTTPVSLGSASVTLGTTASDCFKTYTMVIWIDETNNNQTEADAGKSFTAGVTFTTAGGTGVTGVISAAQG